LFYHFGTFIDLSDKWMQEIKERWPKRNWCDAVEEVPEVLREENSVKSD